jgi:glycosyltransferase involved in cell wall biosynthesis
MHNGWRAVRSANSEGHRDVILHIITNLVCGGAQASTTNACIGLRSLGWNVRLAYSSLGGAAGGPPDDDLLRRLRAADVPLYDVSEMRWPISPAADLRALRQLGALVGTLAPRVVHTHTSKAGVLGRAAALLCRVPIVLHTAHGWSFDSARRRSSHWAFVQLERAAAIRTRRFVAVCRDARERGIARGIGRESDYEIIRSGIDLSRFAPHPVSPQLRGALGVPGDAPVVGTVTRFDGPKAPEILLAVAYRVLERLPNVHFLLVGGGGGLEAMRRAVRERGLDARVHFTGHRADVPDLLQVMDVFLLTSAWEALPRTLVEAAAARLPIVTTNVGGVTEVLRDGWSGILCATGDVEALAEGVLTLLADSDYARALGQAAALGATAEFDTRTMIARHEQLYRGLGLGRG